MTKPIDRQTTTPFHLKLFYRLHNFHHLSDFALSPSPGPSGSYRDRDNGPVSGPNAIRTSHHSPPSATASLPAHLQIYTWPSCTLRELAQLLTSALPSLLPDPPVGTRLCFRLIYPDTKAAATMGPDAAGRGRYLSKDLGSVVVGPRGFDPDAAGGAGAGEGDAENANGNGHGNVKNGGAGGLRMQGPEADKSLQDVRFVIGDYVDCAVLPPLEDGSVAPALTAGRGPIGGSIGGGMRAFRDGPPGGGPRGGRGDRGMPVGDWRRGERLPEGGGGGGRRGWAPY